MSPRRGVAPLRRAAIVRATIRCLARDGYSGLTMRRVAREAKVSQGILHYYFADKRAILVAALETVAADLDRRVAAAQDRGPKDARARLLALVEACLRLAVEERAFWIVFVEFWGEMMHDRRLRTINAALYDRTRRLIGAVVAQASGWGPSAGPIRCAPLPSSSASSTASRSSSPSIRRHLASPRRRGSVETQCCVTSRGRHDEFRGRSEGEGESAGIFQDEGDRAPVAGNPREDRGRVPRLRGIRAPAVSGSGCAKIDPRPVDDSRGRGSRCRDLPPGARRAVVSSGRTAAAGRTDTGEPPVQGAASPAVAVAPRRDHAHARGGPEDSQSRPCRLQDRGAGAARDGRQRE